MLGLVIAVPQAWKPRSFTGRLNQKFPFCTVSCEKGWGVNDAFVVVAPTELELSKAACMKKYSGDGSYKKLADHGSHPTFLEIEKKYIKGSINILVGL